MKTKKVVIPFSSHSDMQPQAFPQYREISEEPSVIEDVEIEDSVEKSNETLLFDEIFGVNPKTKLPDGDIAIFMSENTSPELSDFIRRNLMTPVDVDSDGGKYDGIDDDDLARFTRGHDESVYDYRDRVYDYVYLDSLERRKSNKDDI